MTTSEMVQDTPAPLAHETRPLYWSIRRELWENRSVVWVPLIVGWVTVFGFSLSMIGFPQRRRNALLLDPVHQRAAIEKPYDAVATMILITAILVGIFYCLEALHSERRDRSILFWKSLPVSDRTTIFSKIIVPLLFLPLFAMSIVIVVQVLMLVISSAVLLMSGINPVSTFANFNIFDQTLIMVYGVTATTLWHAPMYSWFLLVGGWAKRAAFLWAFLPFIIAGVIEKMAFNTQFVGMFMQWRFVGFMARAFQNAPKGNVHSLDQLTPWRYLSSPGLWLGLLVAALLLGVAFRMRRYREPI